jgi:hypothetical protein
MVRIALHYTLIVCTLLVVHQAAAAVNNVVQQNEDGDAAASRNLLLAVNEESSQGHGLDMTVRTTNFLPPREQKHHNTPTPASEPTAADIPYGDPMEAGTRKPTSPSMVPPTDDADIPNPRGGDMMGEGDMMGPGGDEEGGEGEGDEEGGEDEGEDEGDEDEGDEDDGEGEGKPTVPEPGTPTSAGVPTESVPAYPGAPTVPGVPAPAPSTAAQLPGVATLDQQPSSMGGGGAPTVERPSTQSRPTIDPTPNLEEPTIERPPIEDQPTPYDVAPSPTNDADVPGGSLPTNGGSEPTPYSGGGSEPTANAEPTADENPYEGKPPVGGDGGDGDYDGWDEQPGDNPDDPAWGSENPPYTYEPPPPKPYQPPSDDILDKNGEKDDDIKDEWEKKSTIQQVEDEADAVLHDKNAKIIAGACGIVAFFVLLVTAQQLIENPEGCCGKLCRCLVAVFRILCWPCRAMCCGSSRAKDRRTHELMRNDSNNYGYSGGSDLELT